MTSSLNLIPHSTTSPKYLESNSTSHVWVFGAVAELIDNSMDAGATQLSINVDRSIKDGPALVFIDNGKGMQTQGLHHMLSFGHCNKSEEEIGRYGNGFKSGSMRIGRDALVFSKCKNTLSLGFLSQTFLKATKALEVLVPIVSWDATTCKVKSDSVSGHKSSSSLDVILNYSPFKKVKDLLNMFGKIKSPSGTCVIIYNLKKLEDGDECSELDFDNNKHDIKIKVTQPANVPIEQISLRAYCAILYLNPTMNIDLLGERVQTVRISSTLLEPIQYTYTPKNVESGQQVSHPVIFGFVPREELKHHYGVMMYNNNRLIKGYVRVGLQLINTHSQGKYIVGVIEANWLQPTHNKQDFFLGQNFAKQYELLLIALGEKLKVYIRDVGIKEEGIGNFTKNLWYPEEEIKSTGSKGKKASKSKKRDDSEEYGEENNEGGEKNIGNSIRARLPRKARQSIEPGSVKEVKRVAVTCASCLKWRLVPPNPKLPTDWKCKDNSDTQYNTCSAPEEDPEGEIPKAPKRRDYSKALIPIDKQIEEMLDEIDQARTQFAKKDRLKEKKLCGLKRTQDEDEYPPTYGEEIVGKKVYIYWRTHDEWFQGKIVKFIESKGTHKIKYKDGDEEEAYLDDQWLYFPDSSSNLPAIEVTGTKVVFPVGNPLVAKKNVDTDSLKEKGVNANKARIGKKRAEEDKKRKRSPSPDIVTKRAKDDKSAAFSAMETELATLRATVKKYMQLQYASNDVDVPDENLVSTFSAHVNNLESNIHVIQAITYPTPSLSEPPIYIPPSPPSSPSPPSPTIPPPSTTDADSSTYQSSEATFFTFV